MGIICDEYDMLFTHVPKTGGVFVEKMLTEHLGGRWVGTRHSSYRWLRLPEAPSVRVMSTRDPVAWYRSYWAFSRGTVSHLQAWPIWSGGRPEHPTGSLDRTW